MLWLAGAAAAAQDGRYAVETQRQGERTLIRLVDNQSGLAATVSPRDGGELCGLQMRRQDRWAELIYRACDYAETAGWRGKAPLLWPATGSTRTGGYTWNGKRYEMPQHGFVQKMAWKVVESGADRGGARVTVELQDTAATREMYPFGWRLRAEYRVADGKLTLSYAVVADKSNAAKMPFSIGNHITFRTPLVANANVTRLQMDLTGNPKLIVKDAQNLPTGEIKERPLPNPTALAFFPVNPAVSLGDFAGTPQMTLRDASGVQIVMRHTASRLPEQPFVQFNLWGNVRDGYFSPEPWVGLQNSFQLDRGRVALMPGESWDWTITIQVKP